MIYTKSNCFVHDCKRSKLIAFPPHTTTTTLLLAPRRDKITSNLQENNQMSTRVSARQDNNMEKANNNNNNSKSHYRSFSYTPASAAPQAGSTNTLSSSANFRIALTASLSLTTIDSVTTLSFVVRVP